MNGYDRPITNASYTSDCYSKLLFWLFFISVKSIPFKMTSILSRKFISIVKLWHVHFIFACWILFVRRNLGQSYWLMFKQWHDGQGRERGEEKKRTHILLSLYLFFNIFRLNRLRKTHERHMIYPKRLFESIENCSCTSMHKYISQSRCIYLCNLNMFSS